MVYETFNENETFDLSDIKLQLFETLTVLVYFLGGCVSFQNGTYNICRVCTGFQHIVGIQM